MNLPSAEWLSHALNEEYIDFLRVLDQVLRADLEVMVMAADSDFNSQLSGRKERARDDTSRIPT